MIVFNRSPKLSVTFSSVSRVERRGANVYMIVRPNVVAREGVIMSVEYVGSGDGGVGDGETCEGYTWIDHKKISPTQTDTCECAREDEQITDTVKECEKKRKHIVPVDLDTDSEPGSDAETDSRNIDRGSNAARGMRATNYHRREQRIEDDVDDALERLRGVKIVSHGKGKAILAKNPDGTVSARAGNRRKVYPANPAKRRPPDGYYSTTSEEGDSDDDYP